MFSRTLRGGLGSLVQDFTCHLADRSRNRRQNTSLAEFARVTRVDDAVTDRRGLCSGNRTSLIELGGPLPPDHSAIGQAGDHEPLLALAVLRSVGDRLRLPLA